MTWKQALLNLILKHEDIAVLSLVVIGNFLHFWLLCAIGHFIPTLHWTLVPYAITAGIWEIFVLMVTGMLYNEYYGDKK